MRVCGFLSGHIHANASIPKPTKTNPFQKHKNPTNQVAQYLRQKGFVSAFEAYNRPRAPHKVERWISHFSHRQEYVGVDFIWHLQVRFSLKGCCCEL